jgi:glycosyltransferase involved in cell wall biosynthesis
MYISGRMDDLYLEMALAFKSKCKIVTGSDNQWVGSSKQKVATILSPMLYKKYFEYFWVPGPRQYEFARRMGYSNDKIIRNLLTADSKIFNPAFEESMRAKQERYPHTIVYAGRFASTKGLDVLLSAFTAAKQESTNDWKLLLIGNGDVQIPQSTNMTVRGFMSSDELAEDCKNWGAFCLPSGWEPWGVVIHEFTMAGLPIICSTGVGAADGLVINGYNGYVFATGNALALKHALLNVMNSTDAQLIQMGERGHELSKMQSPDIAAYSLMSIFS